MDDSNRDVDKQSTLDRRDVPFRGNSDYHIISDRVRRYQGRRLPRDWEDTLYEELRDRERGCDE